MQFEMRSAERMSARLSRHLVPGSKLAAQTSRS